MRNEKGEITIKSIWKWLRSDNGKKYSFFIFYFFFFIFVFILLSLPNPNSTTNDNPIKQEESTFPYSIKKLESESYKFKYILNISDNKTEYLVSKNKQSIIIKDDIDTYTYNYKNGKLVYDGEEEPISYSSFLDFYEVKRILKNSKLISETKLNETEEYLYNYSIKTSSLIELFDIETINYSEYDLNNEIIVRANKNNEIETVTINILNFIKTIEDLDNEINLTSYEIVLDYGDFNE